MMNNIFADGFVYNCKTEYSFPLVILEYCGIIDKSNVTTYQLNQLLIIKEALVKLLEIEHTKQVFVSPSINKVLKEPNSLGQVSRDLKISEQDLVNYLNVLGIERCSNCNHFFTTQQEREMFNGTCQTCQW